MKSKSGWPVAGLLALALLVVVISSLSAQRFGTAGTGHGDVGRYVLVRNTDDAVILMDSVTGDLYKATPADIKPFAVRHRFMEPPGKDQPAFKDKDRPFTSPDKDFRKDGFKDKDDVKPK